MSDELKSGDRFALTPVAIQRGVRPKGSRRGKIVGDAAADCYRVLFDGSNTESRIYKAYCMPEWQAAVDAA